MMANMNGWDVALLLIAIYLAIVTLVRLMRSRRDALVIELHQEAERERRRQQAERRRERKRQVREQEIQRRARQAQHEA